MLFSVKTWAHTKTNLTVKGNNWKYLFCVSVKSVMARKYVELESVSATKTMIKEVFTYSRKFPLLKAS